MPSLADQIRASRRRRLRLRRAAVVVLFAVPAAFMASRLVATGSPDAAHATTTVSSSVPSMDAATDLQPGLVAAFERAQAEADAAGHDLSITSGFRTAERQAELLEAEIAERGSLEEALWWVFPPERSMHVQGLAIDVGDGPAADWLDGHGARFGLCRVLAWEWWHFEWRERWETDRTCPPPARTPEDAPSI